MIQTARMLLRDFQEHDLGEFSRLLADPQTMAPWGGPFDIVGAERELRDYASHRARHGFAPLAVIFENVLIGDAGLQHLGGRRGDRARLSCAACRGCGPVGSRPQVPVDHNSRAK
jgi:RimJ/RimL family protein N-acetyltransferase